MCLVSELFFLTDWRSRQCKHVTDKFCLSDSRETVQIQAVCTNLLPRLHIWWVTLRAQNKNGVSNCPGRSTTYRPTRLHVRHSKVFVARLVGKSWFSFQASPLGSRPSRRTWSTAVKAGYAAIQRRWEPSITWLHCLLLTCGSSVSALSASWSH